ncbi:MAG: hypothetical protein WBA93_31095 [Microcoleaceae cyanobacterium]
MFNSRLPLAISLSDYVKYDDVSIKDPELVGNYGEDYNHVRFHFLSLQKIFAPKNIRYTKKYLRDAQNQFYLDELTKRVTSESEHLKTFQHFIGFCNMIKQELSP